MNDLINVETHSSYSASLAALGIYTASLLQPSCENLSRELHSLWRLPLQIPLYLCFNLLWCSLGLLFSHHPRTSFHCSHVSWLPYLSWFILLFCLSIYQKLPKRGYMISKFFESLHIWIFLYTCILLIVSMDLELQDANNFLADV